MPHHERANKPGLLPPEAYGQPLSIQSGQFFDVKGNRIGGARQAETNIDVAIAQAEQRTRIELIRDTIRPYIGVIAMRQDYTQEYLNDTTHKNQELYGWLGSEIASLSRKISVIDQEKKNHTRKEANIANEVASHLVGQRTELLIAALYVKQLLRGVVTIDTLPSVYVPSSERADNLPAIAGVRYAYDATVIQPDGMKYDYSRVQVKTGKKRTEAHSGSIRGSTYASHIAIVELAHHLPSEFLRDPRSNVDYLADNIVQSTREPGNEGSQYLDNVQHSIDTFIKRRIQAETDRAKK